MHRFYLPPSACTGELLRLSERESHHAVDVLRLRAGDAVLVLDGAGHELDSEILDPSRRGVTLRVTGRRTPPAPPCAVTLLQAVPKGKAMETILQKATELGARRIVPLLTEHCTVQLDAQQAADKRAKYEQTVIEALKQSGVPWLPQVDTPVPLKAFLARGERFDLALVGSLRAESSHPRRWFDEFTTAHGAAPASVALWVGPEGDFTGAELEAIVASGARPVTLGPQVLRSETAAIYLLSIAAYEAQGAARL